MRKKYLFIIIILVLISTSCNINDSDNKEIIPNEKTTIIVGRILDSQTGEPIANSEITCNNLVAPVVFSDNNGYFKICTEYKSLVKLIVKSNGYLNLKSNHINADDYDFYDFKNIYLSPGEVVTNIEGFIKKSDNQPISNATVVLTFSSKTTTVKTDSSGFYSAVYSHPGAFHIRVLKDIIINNKTERLFSTSYECIETLDDTYSKNIIID